MMNTPTKYVNRHLLTIVIVLAGVPMLWAQNLKLSNINSTQKTVDTYNYLQTYQRSAKNCMMFGQNLGHGNQIANNYSSYVLDLEASTGKKLPIIGGDFGLIDTFDWERTVSIFDLHSKDGGFVSMSWQAKNPFTGSYYHDGTTYPLMELLEEGSPLNAVWMTELDRAAAYLRQMRDMGIVVVWRPFQEMNGSWFWWGALPGRGNDDFRALWQHMYKYFTEEKGLNNLIWCYSVAMTISQPSDNYYPGNDYVDLIGFNYYDDYLNFPQRLEYLKLKEFCKPLAMTMFGPTLDTSDGNYDYTTLLDIIQDKYADIAFVNISHSWTTRKNHLAANHGAYGLLNTECVVSRDEIDFNVDYSQFANLPTFEMFPMPFVDHFYLLSDKLIDSRVQIEFLTITGIRLDIKTYECFYLTRIDVPSLPAGPYEMRIIVGKSYKSLKFTRL